MWWFWAIILIGAVPALVGLALVLRHPGRGRWRTVALLGFGLGVAAVLGQLGLNAFFFARTDLSSGFVQTLLGPVSMALQALSVIASGFVVAAVLIDRREVPVAGTGPAEPSVDAVDAVDEVAVDDPLAYDPADFEPPRHAS